MLSVLCVRQWCGLDDKTLEDSLYDSEGMNDLVGIDLACESAPDAMTLLKFRRLLLASALIKALLDEISAHLAEKGLLMRAGTIVDATIIVSPGSTNMALWSVNLTCTRRRRRTKNADDEHFGTKAPNGVDAASGLGYTASALRPASMT